jgi:hypothetical protein
VGEGEVLGVRDGEAGGVPGGARVRVRELVSAGVGGRGQRRVTRVGVDGAWFK